MGDLSQILHQIDQSLREQLPPEQHARIPVVLELLQRFSTGGSSVNATQKELLGDLDLVPLLQKVETLNSATSVVSLNDAQTGDITIRDVAHSIIHNTIILSTDPAHAAAHLADGLAAIQEIIKQTPDAHDALLVFRDRLTAARKQVGDLIDLKLLHDLLHGLQYRSLPMLVREVRRFPQDDEALGGIEQCAIDLRDTYHQIDALVAHAAFDPADVLWRDVLIQIADEIQAGLNACEAPRIDRAARHAKSVINTRLSRINTNLVQKAGSLRVANLMAPLRSLHETLIALKVGAAELDRVYNGITGLTQLHQLLTVMVLVHNDWQELDDELNRIEPTLRSDTGDLEYSWPFLRPKIERACQSEENWAREIRSAIEQLAQALAEPQQLKVRRTFDRLQNRISHRFFMVDLELKSLCNQLGDFRDPIDTSEEERS